MAVPLITDGVRIIGVRPFFLFYVALIILPSYAVILILAKIDANEVRKSFPSFSSAESSYGEIILYLILGRMHRDIHHLAPEYEVLNYSCGTIPLLAAVIY